MQTYRYVGAIISFFSRGHGPGGVMCQQRAILTAVTSVTLIPKVRDAVFPAEMAPGYGSCIFRNLRKLIQWTLLTAWTGRRKRDGPADAGAKLALRTSLRQVQRRHEHAAGV